MDTALVTQVEANNRDFLALAESIAPTVAVQPDLLGTWSAREILMHIIAWQEEALAVISAIRDGTYVSRHLDDAAIQAFNDAAVAKRQDHPWDELKRELAHSQSALEQLAHNLPDEA